MNSTSRLQGWLTLQLIHQLKWIQQNYSNYCGIFSNLEKSFQALNSHSCTFNMFVTEAFYALLTKWWLYLTSSTERAGKSSITLNSLTFPCECFQTKYFFFLSVYLYKRISQEHTVFNYHDGWNHVPTVIKQGNRKSSIFINWRFVSGGSLLQIHLIN